MSNVLELTFTEKMGVSLPNSIFFYNIDRSVDIYKIEIVKTLAPLTQRYLLSIYRHTTVYLFEVIWEGDMERVSNPLASLLK